MSEYAIAEDDIMEVFGRIPENKFDGCLTDPPYGIDFMGHDWDRGVPSESCWREVRRILRPGTYLAAFGGTQTWHRLAVAIEDAGFEIIDTLMWIWNPRLSPAYKISQSVDDEKFDGRYTRLKPSWTPILLALNPREGTWEENVEKYGIAGLNIVEGRIGCEENPSTQRRKSGISDNEGKYENRSKEETYKTGAKGEKDGRYPANVCVSEQVKQAFYPDGHDENDDCYYFCSRVSNQEKQAGLEADERQNDHPAVKPIDLCEWLATLIRPPKDASLLNPFSGSGTEVAAGLNSGWTEVLGIEKESDYVDIAHKRVDALTGQKVKRAD